MTNMLNSKSHMKNSFSKFKRNKSEMAVRNDVNQVIVSLEHDRDTGLLFNHMGYDNSSIKR